MKGAFQFEITSKKVFFKSCEMKWIF